MLLLFGSPRLKGATGAEELELAWQLPVALLAYLALRPGWHARESLAAALWPDSDPAKGRARLRSVVHRIRETLPALDGLHIEETRLRFSGATDVGEFEAAVREADWARATRLQREPLLSHVGSTGLPALDDFFEEERQRLRQRQGTALIAWITQMQAEGRDAAEWMQRLGRQDSLNENTVQFLLRAARTPMEAYEACAAFRVMRQRLAVELGERPSELTLGLYRDVQGRANPLAVAGTAVAARSPAPRDLPPRIEEQDLPPAEGTALLGRDTELAGLESLLAPGHARLVTITGLGGAGKTRLALALRDRLARRQVPCAWVDLSAADSLHAMLDTFASAAGMPMRDGPAREQLAHWLADRQLVVFIDNFEQLLPHADVLAALLKDAPGVRFVVTSRERLLVPGEHALALGGLDRGGPASAAFRLFSLNAERLGRSLERADQAPVLELIDYLEGLPLAIELATHWITLLPPAAILAELKADAGFIDAHDAPANRSMRSVLDATWLQLAPAEQDALASLATVQGTMDLETARNVALADAPILLRLAHKALLQRIAPGQLRLHPLVRDFARGRVREDLLQQAEARHAAWFLAEIAKPPAMRTGQFVPDRVARLQSQFDDIAKAWRHAVDHGRWDLVAAAFSNLGVFLLMVSRLEDAARMAAYACTSLPPQHPLHAPLSSMQALAAFRLGRVEEASEVASGALARNPTGVPAVLLHLVLARVHRGQAQGVAHAQQAFDAAARETDDFRLWAADELALCLCTVGQVDRARELLFGNLGLARRNDAIFYEGRSLALLGLAGVTRGEPQPALANLAEALRIFRHIGDHYQIGLCQRWTSQARGLAGDAPGQVDAAKASFEAFETGGFLFEQAECLLVLGRAHLAAGDCSAARAAFKEALRIGRKRTQAQVAQAAAAALAELDAGAARHASADHPAAGDASAPANARHRPPRG